jgi:hypothetical protein
MKTMAKCIFKEDLCDELTIQITTNRLKQQNSKHQTFDDIDRLLDTENPSSLFIQLAKCFNISIQLVLADLLCMHPGMPMSNEIKRSGYIIEPLKTISEMVAYGVESKCYLKHLDEAILMTISGLCLYSVSETTYGQPVLLIGIAYVDKSESLEVIICLPHRDDFVNPSLFAETFCSQFNELEITTFCKYKLKAARYWKSTSDENEGEPS